MVLDNVIKIFLYISEFICLAQITTKMDENYYSRNKNIIPIDVRLVIKSRFFNIIDGNNLLHHLNTLFHFTSREVI